ncbi:hypothetical protein TBLA_0I01300 [Henningerozyma blattae CBS 6284]|uniref:Apurinic-apyrimidinic endonuclease 1 n=1 Tax=Henningerozyma blattae (strain ATCC 34711 / CBS 6284 / DSM 70876 / NBRC 10599 / NRRL Y-10934 / UCD 77-7) TaxID=1071380 RepID=I2H8T8_HENB6|nr:hypothetical protein TBLA_0I01300 [Tetrapisispora blattae CBS 6284]CCH62790.1 hypothetical protein TBLA_0I01300 [Tetrapisispora blattae CBS 6284]
MLTKMIRSTTSKYKFGAHVSTKGGVSNSVTNAYNIGCNSFALFLKSPRKWESPQYTTEEILKFKANCEEFRYDPLLDILPHGQYFINLANPDKEKTEKSFNSLLDDLTRCEQLGIGLYNLHPGSSIDGDHQRQLKQLAEYLNKAIKKTKFVKILLENMSGKGNLVGSDLKDLETVISFIEDKSRIGVCVDTCHTFSAGYDLRNKESFEKFWKDFDDIVGLKYLGAIHLNDSKTPYAANKDLHEKLGEGFIGLETFRLISHDERFTKLPIILETPQKDDTGYGHEINLLEWLETVDRSEDSELKAKIQELQQLGEKSRNEQIKKFEEGEKKKANLQAKRAAKNAKTSSKKRAPAGNDIMSRLSRKRAKKEEDN